MLSFIGSSPAAQVKVADSPSFGKVPPPSLERVGILVRRGREPLCFVDLPTHIGWLARHPNNGMLYAVGSGKLMAMEVGAEGSLKIMSSADVLGNPAHFEISADGAWAICANYSASTLCVLPILAGGSIGAASDSKTFVIKPKPELSDRQEASHPHMVRLSPGNNAWALTCDLGADTVWVHAFDGARGALIGASNSKHHLLLPEGSGPVSAITLVKPCILLAQSAVNAWQRHLDFHPNDPWVYVLCELDGNIVACNWDEEAGILSPFQTVYSLPEGVAPCRAHHSGGAHILVSKDGKNLYVSTRGDGSLVVFDVEATTGMLKFKQRVDCGGVCPRNFVLDYKTSSSPTLMVGNQDSQNLTSFSIAGDGTLSRIADEDLKGVCPNVLTTP